jgi:hypothetical protein
VLEVRRVHIVRKSRVRMVRPHPELCLLLIARYPGRIAWIDPTHDARALLGDDLSASGKIRAFLAEHRISPPTGDWAMRE